jgi:L-cysteine/cystine lyase
LVSFTLDGRDGRALATTTAVQRLGAQGLWIRNLEDPDCLRACTHITTTTAEIDQLLDALDALHSAS